MSENNEQLSGLPRSIGKIGNYHGGLSVKTEDGRHYWSIENYDGDNWEEIPAALFDALNAFEDSKLTPKSESDSI